MQARYPERIVCLTEETVETLYLPGEQDRVVGISGFTVRPPEARRELCGKKFRPEKVAARPGWHSIEAVRHAQLHEIKSPDILQPGPAALTDGLDQLVSIIGQV